MYVRAAGIFTVAILGVGGVTLAIWPRLWLGLFTHDAAVLDVGAAYFAVVGPSYPFLGVSMVLAFAFQGLGRATAPMVLMAIRVTLVLTGAIVVTRGLGMGAPAVFVVIAAGNVASTLMLLALWRLRGPGAAVIPAGTAG
jgi:Na+-driven multidrug efflux pump